jgi:hypothetical protein
LGWKGTVCKVINNDQNMREDVAWVVCVRWRRGCYICSQKKGRREKRKEEEEEEGEGG